MKSQKGFALYELVFLIAFFAFWGTAGYIVWHFISKFW
jgi:hypothetical protein